MCCQRAIVRTAFRLLDIGRPADYWTLRYWVLGEGDVLSRDRIGWQKMSLLLQYSSQLPLAGRSI